MTPRELLTLLDQHSHWVFLSGLLFAVVGTLAAWVGKGGSTDEDGRFIASSVIIFAVGLVLFELGIVAVWGLSTLTDTNLLLSLTPPVCAVAALFGVSRVFSLKDLGGFQRLTGIVGICLVTAAIIWLLSRFHWGVIFFGGLAQAGLIFLAIAFVLHLLWRRARGR